jgi:hypothetical protein
MTNKENALARAAIMWWEARRPPMWTVDDHLNAPKHRTVGCIDEQLALAVAEYVRSTRTNQ